MGRLSAAAAAAILCAACRTPPAAIPTVILPGLERRVEPAASGTAAAHTPAEPTDREPLPLFPTPEGRLAALGGRFSFELPRGWKAPVEAAGGAALVDGAGRAGAGISFYAEGEPGWESPADFKRRLRAWGSVEDSPLFETVKVGERWGTRRRWTLHRYKGAWNKLGQEAEVMLTETVLVPDREGIYVLWFRAPKAEFAERRAGFAELLRSLKLPPAGPDGWRPTTKERRSAVPVWQ